MVRICACTSLHALTATDEQSLQPRRFLVQVDETLKTLLSREDSDGNYQITIDDKGPKVGSGYAVGRELASLI